ncbi:Rrf2 family transcriptional regulator [Arthrobacter sp. NEB 688]|uniref:RrF2 family transcriptional regulator n=1 Tax=Arthrobacter sp. NEB 688 TaxID=904039 RepID=UPI001564CFAA|nr:Rrf2 family transcriptional regulator [Arthrobacter sp. NEB 688]QKE84658.1 Rrf2 family transcriptional regulator [Arthrobacter sp. NEB 688]
MTEGLCAGTPRPARHSAVLGISARTDYAVRAMLALADARAEGLARTSAEQLAQGQGLPRKFLEAILLELRVAGLVTSRRGPRGGYVLARPAPDITLGDVFRAVDGPLAEVRGLRPQDTAYEGVAEHLPALWVAVRSSLSGVLDGTSLQDLLDGDLPPHVARLVEQPDSWGGR